MIYDLTLFIENLRSRGRRLDDAAGIAVQAWSTVTSRAIWKLDKAKFTTTTRDWPTAGQTPTGRDAKLSPAPSLESSVGATTRGSWGSTSEEASSAPSGPMGHRRGGGSSCVSIRAREDYSRADTGAGRERLDSPARQAAKLHHLEAENAELKRQLHEAKSDFARRDRGVRQSIEQLTEYRDEARTQLVASQKRIDQVHLSFEANVKLANDLTRQLREERRQHHEAKQEIEARTAQQGEERAQAYRKIEDLYKALREAREDARAARTAGSRSGALDRLMQQARLDEAASDKKITEYAASIQKLRQERDAAHGDAQDARRELSALEQERQTLLAARWHADALDAGVQQLRTELKAAKEAADQALRAKMEAESDADMLRADATAARQEAQQAERARQEAKYAKEAVEARMQTLRDDLQDVRQKLDEERERPGRGMMSRGAVRAAPRQAEHGGGASGASAGGMQDEEENGLADEGLRAQLAVMKVELFKSKERIAELEAGSSAAAGSQEGAAKGTAGRDFDGFAYSAIEQAVQGGTDTAAELTTLQSEVDALKQTNAKLRADLGEATARCTALEQGKGQAEYYVEYQLLTLQGKLDETTARCTTLKYDKHEAEDELSSLKLVLSTQQQDVSRLEEDMAKLQEENAELKKQAGRAEKDNAELQTNMKRAMRDVEDLEDDLDNERRKHEAALGNLQRANARADRAEEETRQLRYAVGKMRQDRQEEEDSARQLHDATDYALIDKEEAERRAAVAQQQAEASRQEAAQALEKAHYEKATAREVQVACEDKLKRVKAETGAAEKMRDAFATVVRQRQEARLVAKQLEEIAEQWADRAACIPHSPAVGTLAGEVGSKIVLEPWVEDFETESVVEEDMLEAGAGVGEGAEAGERGGAGRGDGRAAAAPRPQYTAADLAMGFLSHDEINRLERMH